MLSVLKRHAIPVLVAAGQMHVEVARFVGMHERNVRRVAQEEPVTELHVMAPPAVNVGRTSTAEPYRPLITEPLATEPALLSVEVLRRARLDGYRGDESALYEPIATLRPREVPIEMRFEGLPGEFSVHGFGQVTEWDPKFPH